MFHFMVFQPFKTKKTLLYFHGKVCKPLLLKYQRTFIAFMTTFMKTGLATGKKGSQTFKVSIQ
jgi:hypothetical protein